LSVTVNRLRAAAEKIGARPCKIRFGDPDKAGKDQIPINLGHDPIQSDRIAAWVKSSAK
jgi:hypothetical protein